MKKAHRTFRKKNMTAQATVARLKIEKNTLPSAANRALVYDGTWQTFYVATDQWKTELNYVDCELTFFRRLMFEYFAPCIDGAPLEQTRKLSGQETRIEKRRAALEERVLDQRHHLAHLLENPIARDAQICYDQQMILQEELAEFLKAFRQFKQNLFVVATNILRGAKGEVLASGIT
ncbi:hypothetical protein [Chryseolinea lacunae]|uniref:Uncharacterized protein n=1 Tax=Chryseolinea lacunae TaxID=2801331 RepID=A0ABS1KNK6_9BACT|nr:hypothetical protein [Chryseolinea lacunae]MBL0741045.1 hypothetical protein [Chryseolinea lacunae]